MLNRVVLIGRLTADPELRYTPSGVPVASFRVAVNRAFTNASGERETDFINIVAWRRTAEFVTNYLNKGRLVAIEGRLQIRQWQTNEGQRRETAEVVADSVQALERKREAGAPGSEEGGYSSEPSEVSEGDVPGPWDDQ